MIIGCSSENKVPPPTIGESFDSLLNKNPKIYNKKSGDIEVGIIDSSFKYYIPFNDSHGTSRLIIDNSFLSKNFKERKSPSHGSKVALTFFDNIKNEDIKSYAISSSIGGDQVRILPKMYKILFDRGIKIYNQSFGTDVKYNNIKDYKLEDYKKTVSYSENYHLFDIYKNGVNNGSVFIWAAGNAKEGETVSENPVIEGIFPMFFTQLEKGWIVVTAISLDENKSTLNRDRWKIAPYSYRAGVAKNYTIAADGEFSYRINGKLTGFEDGTSFAAPRVAAAAALVLKKFPWMDGNMIKQTLLSTAVTLDSYGVGGSNQLSTVPNNQIGWGVLNPYELYLNGPARFDKRLALGDNVIIDIDNKNYRPENITFSNNITGDAGVIKRGSGKIIFSGKNSYSGNTKIEKGELKLSGSINSNLIIDKDGQFTAKNKNSLVKVGKDIKNDGTLTVLGEGLHINGSYEGKSNSKIEIGLANSIMHAKGPINLNNIPIVLVLKDNEYVSNAKTQRKIIYSDSLLYNVPEKKVENKYSFITISSNEENSSLKITYYRNSVTQTASLMSNLSRSKMNTLKNLDKSFQYLDTIEEDTEFKGVAAKILSSSSNSLKNTLNSLSGEIFVSSENIIFKQSKILSKNISNRLYSINSEENIDKSGAFGNAILSYGKIEKEGFAKAKTVFKGIQAGIDKKFDNLILGLGGSISSSNASFDKYAGTSQNNNITLFTYGNYKFKDSNFYTSFNLGLGLISTEVERELHMNTLVETSKVKHSDKMFSTYIELGYLSNINDNLSLNIFGGLSTDSLIRGKFSEENKMFGLKSDNKIYNKLYSTIGLRGELKFDNIKLNSHISQNILLTNGDLDFKASFFGDNHNKIDIKGIPLAKSSTWVGVGLEGNLSDNLVYNLNYDIGFERGKVSENMISAGFRFKF